MSKDDAGRHTRRHHRRQVGIRGAAGAVWSSGVARLAGANYITYLFGAITGPLSARALGPAGRGEAAVILNLVMLATLVLSLSVGAAAGHILTNAKVSEEEALGAVCRFALYSLPVSTAIGAAFLLAGPTQSFGFTGRAMGAVLILLAPLFPITQALEFVLLSRGDLVRLANIRIISFCGYSLIIAILAVLGVLTTAWFVGLTMVQGFLALGMFIRAAGIRIAYSLQIMPLVRYGIRQLGGNLMSFANFRADQLLLAPFLGFGDLGIYAVAVNVAMLPMSLATAVGARALSTSGTADEFFAHSASAVFRRVFLLTTVACVLLAAAAPLALPLAYGREFSGVAGVLFLLLPGTVALAGASAAVQLLTVLGRPGTLSLAELAALVANGLLLVALVPRYGIRGAAVATSLSYWVRLGVLIWSLRGAGVTGRALIPGRGDVASLVQRLLKR